MACFGVVGACEAGLGDALGEAVVWEGGGDDVEGGAVGGFGG